MTMHHEGLGPLSPLFNELLERAAERRAQGSTPRVAFDCDQTLIEGDIGEAALATLALRAELPTEQSWWAPLETAIGAQARDELRLQYLEARDAQRVPPALCRALLAAYESLCKRDVRQGYLFAAGVWQGRALEEQARLAEDLVGQALSAPLSPCDQTETLSSRGVRVRPLMRALVKALEAEGVEVWVVSSSERSLVAALATRLGLSSSQVLGLDFELIEGRVTGQPIEPIVIERGKCERFMSVHAEPPIGMFGDSQYDLPLMELSAWGVLIDHGDEALAARARALGVYIIPATTLRPNGS